MATVSAVGSASELSLPTGTGRIAADRVVLEGPHSRLRELWLVLRTPARLHRRFPCSAFRRAVRHRVRIGPMPEDHPYYALAREVGRRLATQGFTVMTGGGPGLMEAANRGARDGGGLSVGCNIKLPAEQQPECLPRSIGDVRVTSSSGRFFYSSTRMRSWGCPAESARWTKCSKH